MRTKRSPAHDERARGPVDGRAARGEAAIARVPERRLAALSERPEKKERENGSREVARPVFLRNCRRVFPCARRRQGRHGGPGATPTLSPTAEGARGSTNQASHGMSRVASWQVCQLATVRALLHPSSRVYIYIYIFTPAPTASEQETSRPALHLPR